MKPQLQWSQKDKALVAQLEHEKGPFEMRVERMVLEGVEKPDDQPFKWSVLRDGHELGRGEKAKAPEAQVAAEKFTFEKAIFQPR